MKFKTSEISCAKHRYIYINNTSTRPLYFTIAIMYKDKANKWHNPVYVTKPWVLNG